MKKLLLDILLIAGCDHAPTEHTHEGVCTEANPTWDGHEAQTCYTDWSERDCLAQELYYEKFSFTRSVAWYYMTCDEFCADSTSYESECNIETGPR